MQVTFMEEKFHTFLASLARCEERMPDDLATALRRLPEADEMPSPWESWTLIGLIRHWRRQQWVAEIVHTRLSGDRTRIAEFGAFGHPDEVPQSGTVPGLPEWEFYFHGRGCCLTHKLHGESIDVDFFDDSADYFDTWFFERFLESLRRADLPEQRLRELHPSVCGLSIAIFDLLAAGGLVPLPGRDCHPYRLSDEVAATADRVDSFCTAWHDKRRRLWLAALIGDWLTANDLASGDAAYASVTSGRAARCRELREARLQRELHIEFRGADALAAMADLKPKKLDYYIESALQGPPSGTVSVALDIIERDDDPRWCPAIRQLLSRVNPKGPLPQPHLWITSLRLLLRHRYRVDEAHRALQDAAGHVIGEAVLLSLEHAVEFAIPLIRRALLDDVPTNRTEVAATLALINSDWSCRELLSALQASDDQERTSCIRAALLETGNEAARQAVMDWEARNPHEREAGSWIEVEGRRLGPFYSVAEHAVRDRQERMIYEMQKLHDRVMPLRMIVPLEPDRKTIRSCWLRLWGR